MPTGLPSIMFITVWVVGQIDVRRGRMGQALTLGQGDLLPDRAEQVIFRNHRAVTEGLSEIIEAGLEVGAGINVFLELARINKLLLGCGPVRPVVPVKVREIRCEQRTAGVPVGLGQLGRCGQQTECNGAPGIDATGVGNEVQSQDSRIAFVEHLDLTIQGTRAVPSPDPIRH